MPWGFNPVKDYILFLNSNYKKDDLPFYKKLCKTKITIAVDRGYEFFRKTKTFPDILLGDFDSLGSIPKKLPSKTMLLEYPENKNLTDSHIALKYCLHQRAKNIDIVQPEVGEVDHFLGNFFMLALKDITAKKSYKPNVRIISPEYEIRLVYNDTTRFNNCQNDTISIIPLLSVIILTCKGMAYNADNLTVKQGDSRSLRNQIASKRAEVKIQGRGLVYHKF
jgi:thiamine pyrophosphokinase